MSKKISELLPSDSVMIEVGPHTQYNKETGQLDIIEPAKTIPTTYGYYLAVTQDAQGTPLEEFNVESGFSKTIGRTIKLVGQTAYEDQTTDRGETIPVPVVAEFATDASRAAAKAAAEKAQKDKEKADAEAEKKAKEAEKAKTDFETEQAQLAQEEQQKREVAQKAADLSANKTPEEARTIGNAISESADKVEQGIDDKGQSSAPVTSAVAKTKA